MVSTLECPASLRNGDIVKEEIGNFIVFYFIICTKSTRNIMSTLHHTKLQVDGPSGHCSKLHLHSPPEVQ